MSDADGPECVHGVEWFASRRRFVAVGEDGDGRPIGDQPPTRSAMARRRLRGITLDGRAEVSELSGDGEWEGNAADLGSPGAFGSLEVPGTVRRRRAVPVRRGLRFRAEADHHEIVGQHEPPGCQPAAATDDLPAPV